MLALVVLAGVALPGRARTQDTSTDGAAILDRALAFLRAHPRARGRFEHTYFDRSRTERLSNRGTFVLALPRARIVLEGELARTITIDDTFARVLIPTGAAPLALSFRLATTPLPTLLAALAGETPIADLFTVRRVDAASTDVVELRPIDPSATIDRLWLEVRDDGELTRLLVVDTIGGTHRVALTDVRHPASLPESSFTFEVPAGSIELEP